MVMQYGAHIKSPWLGAGVALVLIWVLWGLDLHPHFSTGYAPAIGNQGFDVTTPACTPQIPTGEDASLSTTGHSTDTKSRPLILFAFFDTPLARRNLEYFIAHALHDAADFLFIINGETDAHTLVPDKANIRYIKRKNDCYDMGAFAEVLLKDDLYKKYQRFITLNASIRGPFFPAWSKSCWSDTYLDRITDETKLVGMTLGCRPLPHVQSMIWAFDRVTLDILLYPSKALIEKFTKELPPHDPGPVPVWEVPGINSCPHEYWKAVAVEVHATPLIRSAGYKTDVMMAAYHSIPKYETACRSWLDGDVLSHGHYYGMDLHPFDTVFAKTNRGNDPLTLEKMTQWTDERKYSSYDYCH